MTALAKNPHSRFANMRAFANALEQAYRISLPPAPSPYQPVNISPKQELPIEMKPIQQMPVQRPASTALPPVTNYTPPRPPQPSSGTLSMPVASPDTYTISKPLDEPPKSAPPIKKKRKWFF